MTYHRSLRGLGQDTTFTLEETQYRTAHPTATDAEVAAAIAAPSSTTTSTASTASKGATTTAAPSTGGGKGGGGSTSWAPQTGTPITSAVYSATPSSGTPHWVPWAIGGTVAVLGLGLFLAARR